MISIVPLMPENYAQVAALHLHYLETRFYGKPGVRLLEAYYATLALPSGPSGGCGFVAVDERGDIPGHAVSSSPPGGEGSSLGAGQVVGYVCGVWAPDRVRGALLRTRWPALVFWGVAQVVVRPRLLKLWLRGAFSWRPKGRRRAELPAGRSGYELRPIVVVPEARGRGIGTRLVQALLADASRRGFDRVHLYVADDNVAATALYCKAGFRPVSEEERAGERRVRYEYSFGRRSSVSKP